MTKSILDSMNVNKKIVFFDHFHLKMNLEKTLLSTLKILKPYNDIMFTTSDEDVLSSIYTQTITTCKDSNNSVMILRKLMKTKFGSIYFID